MLLVIHKKKLLVVFVNQSGADNLHPDFLRIFIMNCTEKREDQWVTEGLFVLEYGRKTDLIHSVDVVFAVICIGSLQIFAILGFKFLQFKADDADFFINSPSGLCN